MKENRISGNVRSTAKIRRYEKLDAARQRIDEVDSQLAALLAERLSLANEIGTVKADLHLGIMDKVREQEVLARVSAAAPDDNIRDAIKDIYQAIFAASRQLQARNSAQDAEPLYFSRATIMRFGKNK